MDLNLTKVPTSPTYAPSLARPNFSIAIAPRVAVSHAVAVVAASPSWRAVPGLTMPMGSTLGTATSRFAQRDHDAVAKQAGPPRGSTG